MCGVLDCGSALTKTTSISPNGKKNAYLRCRLYAESGKSKKCTRHGIRLDGLVELVSQRIRYYVYNYFDINKMDFTPGRDTRREALEQERHTLATQLEKQNLALRSLYLDKVSGVITEGQFVDLNQSFLTGKGHLEKRLAQLDKELVTQTAPQGKAEIMAKAQELLKLNTIPRELVTLLIEKIEVGEKNPDTGNQEVKITWKF